MFPGMEPRCAWSGERSGRAVPVAIPASDRLGRPTADRTVHVLPEHAEDLRRFADRVRRRGRLFLGVTVVLVVGIVTATLLGAAGVVSEAAVAAMVGAALAALGLLLIALPFATPETVAWLGVRRSIRVARLLGAITLVLGVLIGVAS